MYLLLSPTSDVLRPLIGQLIGQFIPQLLDIKLSKHMLKYNFSPIKSVIGRR